jgi:hypothetical protein
MAVVDKGIKIEVPESLIPDGFNAPAYIEVTDYEYKREYQLNVLKSTVENATEVTTFGNIINEAAIGILKQVLDLITADFINTNTVDYYTVWKVISSNVQRSKENDFYNDTPFSYICKVEVYIKTT